jgi:hypothetical protein
MPSFIEGKTAAASIHMNQRDSLQAFQWGLKKASSRAKEIAEAYSDKKRSIPTLLGEFVAGISQAEGAAGQLIHHFRNPNWIYLRNTLSVVKDKCVGMAVKGSAAKAPAAWSAVAKMLDAMLENGNTLANKRPMTESEIIILTDRIKENMATKQ